VKRPRARSTVPRVKPPASAKPKGLPTLRAPAKLPARRQQQVGARAPHARVAQVIDSAEASLLDVIDSLLSKGVVLNAEVVLALAHVDLVYLWLSALLCAADRILPPSRR
jgi:hypothetical protein